MLIGFKLSCWGLLEKGNDWNLNNVFNGVVDLNMKPTAMEVRCYKKQPQVNNESKVAHI